MGVSGGMIDAIDTVGSKRERPEPVATRKNHKEGCWVREDTKTASRIFVSVMKMSGRSCKTRHLIAIPIHVGSSPT